MNLTHPVRLRAPGMPSVIKTVEQAIEMIDQQLPIELRQLPRWTFARALLIEALKTEKARDLTIAIRQLEQALSNEKWLLKSD